MARGGGGYIRTANAAGVAGTGDGGGGPNNTNFTMPMYGFPGGSGTVVVAVPQADTSAVATGAVTVTSVGTNQIFVFNGAGTLTF